MQQQQRRPTWDTYRRNCGFSSFPDSEPISDATTLMFAFLVRRDEFDALITDETWLDCRASAKAWERLSKKRFWRLVVELHQGGYLASNRVAEKWRQRMIKHWKSEMIEDERFDPVTGHVSGTLCRCESCARRMTILKASS
jgi:hypothetical protein